MRNWVIKIIMIIGFIAMTGHNTHMIHAQSDAEVIKKMTADVNGNGDSQSVLLMGETMGDDTDYYQDIWLKMPSMADKDVIHYGGGYNPSIKMINDETNQKPLLVFIDKKEATNYRAHFYNEEKGKFTQIPMPALEYIDLTIKDGYSIEIKTTPIIKPIKADIESDSQDIKDKLFDQNGDAEEQASLWISSDTKYEVKTLEENNILQSSTLVRAQNKDGPPVGYIVTKWRFSNGEWTNIQTGWQHADSTEDA